MNGRKALAAQKTLSVDTAPNTAERSFLHSSAKTEVDLTVRCFPGLRDGGTSRPAEEVERSARAVLEVEEKVWVDRNRGQGQKAVAYSGSQTR